MRDLGGDGCVALDQGGHDSTGRLDAERERSNIQKQEVVDSFVLVSIQDGGLDSSAVGNGLVRVDRLVKVLSVGEI